MYNVKLNLPTELLIFDKPIDWDLYTHFDWRNQ